VRTTFILELEQELVEFIYNQQNFEDPSIFVNHIVREERKRQGFIIDKKGLASYESEAHVALEEFLDENTFAAD
jgi:hypothetical protein